MSRVLPILFNTEMVQAILAGRKTVTRRVIKNLPEDAEFRGWLLDSTCQEDVRDIGKAGFKTLKRRTEKAGCIFMKPPYQPEDILYVRETWRVGAWDIRNQMIAFDYKDGTCGKLTYIHDRNLFERLVNQSREDARKAGCEYNGVDFVWEKGKSPCRWHPSIHMPKEAVRIFLKVKDVRVERLQDITEKQAETEGINGSEALYDGYIDAREKFAELWDSTIKKSDTEKYGWSANPWVWVIEFERCEKPEEWK